MKINNAIFRIVGASLLLLIGNWSMAQINLTVDATQNYTNFHFVDGDGVKDNNYVGKYVGAYDLGIQADLYNGLYFRATIGMMNAGATHNFNENHNDWDLQYMRIQMGLGYHHQWAAVGTYLSVSPYYSVLTRGSQRLENRAYNLLDEQFESNDFGIAAMGGLTIPLTTTLSANTGINYSKGFTNLESENSDQTATNYSAGLSLGVIFSIK